MERIEHQPESRIIYRVNKGGFDLINQHLVELAEGDLRHTPNDPWGRPYQYLNPGLKGEVDVLSLGADGQAGGEGLDADIGSWQ